MIREVLPEILDELDPSDPRAVRSRRDLRLANKFMQGESWILRQVGELVAKNPAINRVIELGAGEGFLTQLIKTEFPHLDVVAVDLVAAPEGFDPQVRWDEADVLAYDGYEEGSIVVANLFIHHLQDEQIRELAEKMQDVAAILFAEPYRKPLSLMMGRCIFPLVNDVTRHDMMVSVRAGFIGGDLPALLGEGFHWQESLGLIGGIRLRGERCESHSVEGESVS